MPAVPDFPKNFMFLVLSTFPSEAKAAEVAQTLLAENLIACANLLPGVRSLYRWQGQLCDEAEVLVLLKCPAAGYAQLEARLRELHPYEVPEIVALRPEAVLPAYAEWVRGT